MKEYRFTKDQDGELIDCDSCDYPAPVADYPTGPRLDRKRERKHRFLCELCAGSHASTAEEYPEQFPDGRAMRTVCNVGNAILTQLGKFKDVATVTITLEDE